MNRYWSNFDHVPMALSDKGQGKFIPSLAYQNLMMFCSSSKTEVGVGKNDGKDADGHAVEVVIDGEDELIDRKRWCDRPPVHEHPVRILPGAPQHPHFGMVVSCLTASPPTASGTGYCERQDRDSATLISSQNGGGQT